MEDHARITPTLGRQLPDAGPAGHVVEADQPS